MYLYKDQCSLEFSTQQMKARELQADLATLYDILPKPKGKSVRDHHRVVLPKLLAFDARKILL